jgi:biotin carboxylase
MADFDSIRVGLLFNYDWDAPAHQEVLRGLAVDYAGFNMLSVPGAIRLFSFDLDRYADQIARRGRARDWAAVVSHHELYGALVAAMVAERLGLPGPNVSAVLACQHKLYARRILQEVCPEENLFFAAVDAAQETGPPSSMRLPVHVKPVRATFSMLARVIDSPTAWRQYFARVLADQWITRRFIGPFDTAVQRHLPNAGSSQRFIAEEPVWHPQYNLDGFCDQSGTHLLGVVDAVSYPGTQAFQRWEFPSRLPPAVISRALDVARRFLAAVGFGHGFFNMEFFYDPVADRMSVIEFNPRLSSQFGDLYRGVLGLNPHEMALAIAQGREGCSVQRRLVGGKVGASLVWRAFSWEEIPPRPSRTALARFACAFPEAQLTQFSRVPFSVSRELSWMQSHRYGVVNLVAEDQESLRQKSAQISYLLGWPNAPYVQSLSELALGHGTWLARPR